MESIQSKISRTKGKQTQYSELFEIKPRSPKDSKAFLTEFLLPISDKIKQLNDKKSDSRRKNLSFS